MFIIKKILYVLLLFFITSKFILANSAQEEDVSAIPLDEIRTFTEIFSKIKSDYVENIDDELLLENAIRGMLEGLDPHSAYLDKDAYKELQEGTSCEFGGCAGDGGVTPSGAFGGMGNGGGDTPAGAFGGTGPSGRADGKCVKRACKSPRWASMERACGCCS